MRFRLLITLILVVLVAGACGDDDLGVLTPSADDAIPGNNPPISDDSDNPFGGGDLTGFTNEECYQVAFAWSQAASLGFGGAGSIDDSVEALDDLAEVTPPEIAADFALYTQALVAYSQALADAGIDFNDPATMSTPEAAAAMAAAAEAFDDPEVQDSAERISDYLDTQCALEE